MKNNIAYKYIKEMVTELFKIGYSNFQAQVGDEFPETIKITYKDFKGREGSSLVRDRTPLIDRVKTVGKINNMILKMQSA